MKTVHLLAVTFILDSAVLAAMPASAQDVSSPSRVGHARAFAISPAMRDLYPELFSLHDKASDAGLLLPAPPPSTFTIGVSVDGISGNGGFKTPDPNGAAGSTQYVEYVNNQYEVFDKSGNVVQAATNGNLLWKALGGRLHFLACR